MVRSSALLMLCLAVVSACGGSSDLCLNVVCGLGRICNKASGTCITDPNRPDAAVVTPVGKDAGVDGGSPGCSPACATGEVCDPVSLNCVQCLNDSQCPTCQAPRCDPISLSCVGEDLDAGFAFQPGGESCADAQLIRFPRTCPPATSQVTFEVDLSARIDDLAGTCSLASGLGREAVFLLNVPTTSEVKVSTSPAPGSAAEPVIYLRSSPCQTGAELACRDALGGTGTILVRAPPGVYALVIDSFAQAPRLIDFTTTNSARFTVDTAEAEDDERSTCTPGGGAGRETVYSFSLASQRTVTVTSAAADGGATVDPVLYLRAGGCAADAGIQVACEDELTEVPERLVATLDAGQYFLFVDSYTSSSAGPTAVTITLSP